MRFDRKRSLILALVLLVVGIIVGGYWRFKLHRSERTSDALTEAETAKDREIANAQLVEPLLMGATKVASGSIERYIKAPGIVDFHPKHALRIHSAFSGVVSKVSKNIGDSVALGETLATIETNVGVQVYSVSSPIRGAVLNKNIGEGQSISPEDELFSIGDTTILQARIAIPAHDVKHVTRGQDIIILAEHRAAIRAKISFLSPILDEDSRAAPAIVDIEGSDLRPGMFITGAIVIGKVEIATALPRSFCELELEHSAIAVVTKDKIERRDITFGLKDYFSCEVTEGVKAGEEVVPASLLVTTHDESDEKSGEE